MFRYYPLIDSIDQQSHPKSLRYLNTWIRWHSAGHECNRPNLLSSSRLQRYQRTPFPMRMQIVPIRVCHPIWRGVPIHASMRKSTQSDWLMWLFPFDVACFSRRKRHNHIRITVINPVFIFPFHFVLKLTDNVLLQFHVRLPIQWFCHRDTPIRMSSVQANQILGQQYPIVRHRRSSYMPKWIYPMIWGTEQPYRRSNDVHTKYSAFQMQPDIFYFNKYHFHLENLCKQKKKMQTITIFSNNLRTLHKFLGKCPWIGHRISSKWYFSSTDRVAISLAMPFGTTNVQTMQLNRLYCTCPSQYQMFYNRIVRTFSYFHFYLHKKIIKKKEKL